MTVGETLTEARYQAGLSVDELSERTRIRSTVIRSIEQDDYAACGGELYVRGYVRAIAGAVGIDALPLIREFDQAHLSGGDGDVPPPAGAAGEPDSDATRFDLTAVPASGHPADPDATRFDLPAVPAFDPPADPDATRFDLPIIPGPSSTAVPYGAGPFDAMDFDTAAFDGGLPFGAGAFGTSAPYGEAPPTVVTPAAVPSQAAQPPGSHDTRFDLRPVTEDLMAAGYQLPASQAQAWPGPPWSSAAPPPGAARRGAVGAGQRRTGPQAASRRVHGDRRGGGGRACDPGDSPGGRRRGHAQRGGRHAFSAGRRGGRCQRERGR